MTTAEKVLIIGGVFNLAYSFLTGFFLSAVRSKQPKASKYLIFAHTGPLMQGTMLLGLVFAFQLSLLSKGLEMWSAGLLVAGSVFLAAKDTLNWQQNIQDEFQEKPPVGLALGALSVLASVSGLGIIAVGVVLGL